MCRFSSASFTKPLHQQWHMHIYLYTAIKKSLCACFLYCNHHVHRDLLITLYVTLHLLPPVLVHRWEQ